MPRTPLLIGATAAIALAAALTGCSSGGSPFSSNADETRYPGFAEAQADGFAAPGWLPQDATNLWVRSEGADQLILRYQSPSAINSPECTDGPLEGEPPMESSWFPFERPADGKVCGDWRVFVQGDVTYAWFDAS